MNTTSELTADARATVRTGLPRPGIVHVVNGTHCGLWEESKDFEGVRKIFRETVAMMRARGWSIAPDTTYRSPDWVYGTKGGLGVWGHTGGRAAQFDFFRTAKPWDNPNGAQYEFNKWDRIKAASAETPGLRLLAIVEMSHVIGRWLQYGYGFKGANRSLPIAHEVLRCAEARPYYGDALEGMRRSWGSHYDSDEGWLSDDRYRDAMHHLPGVKRGDVVYFRSDWGPGRYRLQRGVAYPDFNGSWMIDNGSEYVNAFPRQIYREYPEGERRRLVLGQRDRLESELEKARKAKDWKRVAVLAGVLARVAS